MEQELELIIDKMTPSQKQDMIKLYNWSKDTSASRTLRTGKYLLKHGLVEWNGSGWLITSLGERVAELLKSK
ncbi:hypothetical protein [Paenibacillus lactis]|uniref:hypothetical protein n=1 Tax=Paenibacillus lactis TaxID=228574 RepID=UPI003D75B523